MSLYYFFYVSFFYARAQSADFEWVITNGGSYIDASMDNDVDIFGNVYTSGYFYTTVDFNPNAAVLQLNFEW